MGIVQENKPAIVDKIFVALLQVEALCFLSYKIQVHLSSEATNIALHGEPSAPERFSGAAFKR